jgi:cellulose synthase/poly-beta-1,6-N-acetylglucosamine synthase-like glycosyltransferase
LVFWFWFFVGPALLLAFFSLRGERKRAAYVERRLAETPHNLPSASVIVPVKGEDYQLRENLAALAAQDYPDYELVVVAHSAADIPPGVLPDKVRVVLAHGDDPSTGEKVQNLRTAVVAARKFSQIFAFADSDGRVTKRWLRSLVAPLSEEGVGASTGYRWYAPIPPTFWSLMRSVWDAVALSRLGPGDCAFAWGGAMAIRRDVFHELDIRGHWKDTVSDDYSLSDAVRAAGLTIAFAPGAMVACHEQLPAGRLLAWMRRQMTITRVYNARLWWPALVAHFFYCGGMAASVIASLKGYRLAEWTLIAQLSPGMLKGLNRATMAKAALPECEPWFKRHLWVHAIWVPLGTWLWLGVLLSSAFGNTIHWRGYTYTLHPPPPPQPEE